MGEILGLGATHWPNLILPDAKLTDTLRFTLSSPVVEQRYKDRANWPAGALAEWSDDEGVAAAARHRARLVEGFRAVRAVLDDFKPDFLVVWGDDQYENFKEDIVPPFCVFALDDEVELKPWASGFGKGKTNVWNEPEDFAFKIRGHRAGANYLVRGLLKRGVDMPYAYKPLHIDGLSTAFTNIFLYLDWQRKGFPHPAVPFHVNCYGSSLLTAKGGLAHLTGTLKQEAVPTPPSPEPWRCMEVGAKVAQVLSESPWRVALMASSSWSHAFLSPRTGYVWPDQEADRLLFDALCQGDYDAWRNRSLEEMEASGQHEMLNWMVLMGAMEELGRKPVVHDYAETFLFSSEKCFVSFPS